MSTSRMLSLESILLFPPLLLAPGMKFAFEIKTKPVTQVAIIVAVLTFSFGFLAMIAIYANSPTISTFCAVVLATIIYLALRFAPC